MIEKIEFSDINKFLASLGLICIGIAFFLPWFFNNDVSILLLEKDQLDKLTVTANSIIIDQQNALKIINKVIPWVSGVLILVGILLLFYSINRWKKRQAVLDKIQDEDLKYKEIQNLSAKEKRELIENEIDEAEVHSGTLNLKSEIEKQIEVDNYIQIENSIFSKLSDAYKSNYIASQNVKIGSDYYDIILKSKNLNVYRDRIIEIKFFNKHLSLEQLEDATRQLIISSKNYESSFKRRAISILIVIYDQNEYDESLKLFRKQIFQYSKEAGKVIRINFFSKANIEKVKSIQFLNAQNEVKTYQK
ncbi:hypothetical protein ACHRV6_22980 [Flavobacterium sp. FlaQc-51]|uniref:hypothetical protein n=1 Tax=Flavobacterium sp. FlaQc-51 TaxID=3374184 RepID=UPI0037573172